MKKVFLPLVIVAVVFSACKKNYDHVFDQSPDERINAAINSYTSTLTGAANGWKAFIKTDSGKGSTYSFYFKFSTDNRVKMFSDFDSASAVTSQESSYRLKAQQQPTLIFDTYSYVHVLADPNESVVLTDNFVLFSDVNHGPIGKGLLSDFEFIIDNAKIKTDTIELTGKVHNTRLILVRATKPEEDAYNSGQLGAGLLINNILNYFKRLTIGSQLYDIRIDPLSRTFTFSWLDAGGNLQTFTTGYYFLAGSIVFTKPLVNGSQTISGFNDITWTQATQTVNLTVNNTAATIKGIVVPLKVDLTAPQRWYQYGVTNDNYWISITGFHVNGVDDAFGLHSLATGGNTYYYTIYWPKYGTTNDLFAPVFLNAAQTGLTLLYATAPKIPTFTADGRAIFIQLGNYGTYPSTGPAALTKAQLYNPAGYYFVQTDATTYDMVSALDGKAWITWFF